MHPKATIRNFNYNWSQWTSFTRSLFFRNVHAYRIVRIRRHASPKIPCLKNTHTFITHFRSVTIKWRRSFSSALLRGVSLLSPCGDGQPDTMGLLISFYDSLDGCLIRLHQLSISPCLQILRLRKQSAPVLGRAGRQEAVEDMQHLVVRYLPYRVSGMWNVSHWGPLEYHLPVNPRPVAETDCRGTEMTYSTYLSITQEQKQISQPNFAHGFVDQFCTS